MSLTPNSFSRRLIVLSPTFRSSSKSGEVSSGVGADCFICRCSTIAKLLGGVYDVIPAEGLQSRGVGLSLHGLLELLLEDFGIALEKFVFSDVGWKSLVVIEHSLEVGSNETCFPDVDGIVAKVARKRAALTYLVNRSVYST